MQIDLFRFYTDHLKKSTLSQNLANDLGDTQGSWQYKLNVDSSSTQVSTSFTE